MLYRRTSSPLPSCLLSSPSLFWVAILPSVVILLLSVIIDLLTCPHFQVYLHTQLVAQLYAMTAKDPNDAAVQIATNVRTHDSHSRAFTLESI